jgi:hypothetical protein
MQQKVDLEFSFRLIGMCSIAVNAQFKDFSTLHRRTQIFIRCKSILKIIDARWVILRKFPTKDPLTHKH